jgi:hypothetical protein
MYLRSVLAQNYWPESHLAAPSAAALRREVELIKDLGFNTARVHQKAEDPRFLYWADRTPKTPVEAPRAPGRYARASTPYSASSPSVSSLERTMKRLPSGASTEKPLPRPSTRSTVRCVYFQYSN